MKVSIGMSGKIKAGVEISTKNYGIMGRNITNEEAGKLAVGVFQGALILLNGPQLWKRRVDLGIGRLIQL
jgi:hypothetical protein